MDHNQEAKRNMYGKVSLFFTNNSALWATFTRLITEISTFNTLVGQIDAEADKQALIITGAAADKQNFRIAMAKIVVKYARKARVWALDNNNNTLADLFNVQKGDFFDNSESHAIEMATNIATALNDNIASLAAYNVLPANVTAINTAITNFSSATGTTGDAQAVTKSGTDALPGLFKLADHSLDIIYDLIIAEYSESNPDEVAQFKNDHRIDNIAVHHSGVHAHITDSLTGYDLQGVTMSIPAAGKTSTSNINGIADIISIKGGDYNIFFTHSGYTSFSVKTKIKRGKITNLTVPLSAGSGGPSPATQVVLEDNLNSGNIAELNTTGFSVTPATTVQVEISGSECVLSASNTADPVLGPDQWHNYPGNPQTKTGEAFAALVGADDTHTHLKIQCVGPFPAHYKITFNNVTLLP